MGINLKKVLNEDQERLSVNRNASAIKLLIRMAIFVFMVIVVLLIIANWKDKDLERREKIIQDMKVVQSLIKNKASAHNANPLREPLIGTDLSEKPIVISTNGVEEEYRYGYYWLNPEHLAQMTDSLNLPNEDYIVNYDTFDVINFKGIKYKKLEYHTLEDILVVAQNQVPPVRQIIRTPSDLDKLRTNPNGYFKLSGNLDMSSYAAGDGWKPIDGFAGTLDGRGYAIVGLTIARQAADYVGLFSTLESNAKITNLRFENPDVKGAAYVGVLAGANSGQISHVKINGGSVTSSTSYAGGLVGAHSNKTITDCIVDLERISGTNYVGGIVGVLYSGTIDKSGANCEAIIGIESIGGAFGSAKVSNTTYINQVRAIVTDITGQKNMGGLIGEINISTDKLIDVRDCYAIASINGKHDCSGGFVGYVASLKDAKIAFLDCYSSVDIVNKNTPTIGGFFGRTNIYNTTDTSIDKCFFEVITVPGEVLTSTGTVDRDTKNMEAQPKEHDEMLLQGTFTNWDFTAWGFDDRVRTPYLNWERK